MSSTPPPLPPPSDPQGQPQGATPPSQYGVPQGQWSQYPQQGGYPPQQQGQPQYPGYPAQGQYPQQQGYAHPGYYAAATVPETHSTPGKISVAIAVVGWVVFGVAMVVATVAGPNMDENSPQAQLLGLAIMGAMGLNVVGLFLAIGAFFEKNKKRLFAWLGLVFNALPCVCGLGVMALGFAALAAGISP